MQLADAAPSLRATFVILTAVLLSAAPWGVPALAVFVLPLATCMLVFLYACDADPVLPAWCAFGLGLFIDIATAGPLGYWAAMLLLAHLIGRMSADRGAQSGLSFYAAFAICAASLAIAGWMLACIYFLQSIDWRPMLIGAVAAIALAPTLRRWGPQPRQGVWAKRAP